MVSFKQYISEEWETDVMSAEKFVWKIRENPSWCKTIKAPLTIQGAVDLEYSPITHLSPRLTFAGSVYLRDADHLTVLEGTFKDRVQVSYSGIREVKGVSVFGGLQEIHDYNNALVVAHCQKLEKVDAVVYGGVNLSWSSVTDISKLKVMTPSRNGWGVDLTGCQKIETLSGYYKGSVVLSSGSEVKEIRDLNIAEPDRGGGALYIRHADIQKISNFKYKGKIIADDKTLAKIRQLQGQEKAGGKGEFDDLF